MKTITIYTDGACSGNPGPGGWGAVLMYKDHVKEISGAHQQTTNNRMEITAVIQALKHLKEPCDVRLYSDSAYVVNCMQQGWYKNWRKNGWKNSKKQPVENQDLWQELLAVLDQHRVEFLKVKGHADNEWNNRADELATSAVETE